MKGIVDFSVTGLIVLPFCAVVVRFVGKMSRPDADKSLLHSGDSVYLVRESESRLGTFALSIRYVWLKLKYCLCVLSPFHN